MTSWFAFPALLFILTSLYFSSKAWTQLNKTNSCWLDGVILSFCQVVIISQILGTAGILTVINLVLTHALISSIIWLMTGNSPQIKSSPAPDIISKEYLSKPLNKQFVLIASIPVILTIASFIPVLGQAPGGTDVWTYHLAFPAEWHLWHDLRASFQNTGDPGPPYYPHHSGLFAHLLLTTLSSDILARFHQVILWIAGMFALYSGMKNLKISDLSAITATSLVAAMPLVASWLTVAFADISLAGSIALVFYSITRLKVNNTFHAVFTFGMATGLASGFKAFGAFYSLPLIIWGLFIILQNKKDIFLRLGLWFSGAMLSGSFWFLRNLFLNGNPLFPYQLELAGNTIFPGLYNRTQVLSHGFHSFNFMGEFTFHALMKSIGVPGFLLCLSLVLCVFLSIAKHRYHFIVFLPFIMGIQFLILPYRYHPRFLLSAFWMSAPAAGFLFDNIIKFLDTSKNKFLFLLSIITVSVLVTPYSPFKSAIIIPCSLLLLLIIHRVSISLSKTAINIHRFVGMISIIILLSLVAGFPGILNYYENNKWNSHSSDLGKIAIWLTEISHKINHLEIAFTGFNTPYPLFGPHFCNSVRFISWDGIARKSWTGNIAYEPPAQTKSIEAWERLLEDIPIDLIVIGTIPGQNLPSEYYWIRSCENFQLVYLVNNYQCWMRNSLVKKIL